MGSRPPANSIALSAYYVLRLPQPDQQGSQIGLRAARHTAQAAEHLWKHSLNISAEQSTVVYHEGLMTLPLTLTVTLNPNPDPSSTWVPWLWSCSRCQASSTARARVSRRRRRCSLPAANTAVRAASHAARAAGRRRAASSGTWIEHISTAHGEFLLSHRVPGRCHISIALQRSMCMEPYTLLGQPMTDGGVTYRARASR